MKNKLSVIFKFIQRPLPAKIIKIIFVVIFAGTILGLSFIEGQEFSSAFDVILPCLIAINVGLISLYGISISIKDNRTYNVSLKELVKLRTPIFLSFFETILFILVTSLVLVVLYYFNLMFSFYTLFCISIAFDIISCVDLVPLVSFNSKRIVRMIRLHGKRQGATLEYDNEILTRLISGLLECECSASKYLENILLEIRK